MKRVFLPAIAAAALSLCALNPTHAQTTATYGPGAGGNIPDFTTANGAGSISSTINVAPPAGSTVQSINSVTITGLTHTWVGDLTATLTHGSTSLTFLNRPGGAGNSGNFTGGTYTFAPGGSTITNNGNVDIAPGTYSPAASFSAFAGLLLAGDWTLRIADNAAADTGSFTGWSFNTTYGPPPPPPTGTGAGGNLVDATPTVGSNVATPGVFTSDIMLSSSASITSFDSVFLYGLNHTNIGDLKATITHVDTGTVVDLFSRPGVTTTDPFDYGFDANFAGNYTFTQGGTSLTTTAAGGNTSYNIPTGTYAASTSQIPGQANTALLSAFAGQSLGGTWRLTITDYAAGDTGVLGSWGFNATVGAAAVPEPSALSLIALGIPTLGAYRLRRRTRHNKN